MDVLGSMRRVSDLGSLRASWWLGSRGSLSNVGVHIKQMRRVRVRVGERSVGGDRGSWELILAWLDGEVRGRR